MRLIEKFDKREETKTHILVKRCLKKSNTKDIQFRNHPKCTVREKEGAKLIFWTCT